MSEYDRWGVHPCLPHNAQYSTSHTTVPYSYSVSILATSTHCIDSGTHECKGAACVWVLSESKYGDQTLIMTFFDITWSACALMSNSTEFFSLSKAYYYEYVYFSANHFSRA